MICTQDIREQLIKQFLKINNIFDYHLQKIVGDASFRCYYRVKCDDKSFIVMDAPPLKENINPFCKIDNLLLSNNFSAPKIFAQDKENGLLLLEDFGDNSYRKILEQGGDEIDLYTNAVDLLIDLRKITIVDDLPRYDDKLLLAEVMLFMDWYLPNIAKQKISNQQIAKFKQIWLELFSKLSLERNLVLRDYHSDNLMLLTKREGVRKVGLLDFQDAILGCAAYDLVSLLEDARRDVSLGTQQKMLQHYLKHSNCNKNQFMIDYKILSLQRNIKIVGIFARLAIRDQKADYLKFLPRVFGYINSNLQDEYLPCFFGIKETFGQFLIQNK